MSKHSNPVNPAAQRARYGTLLTTALVGLATAGQGSLWQSPHWALTARAEAAAAYDSNLFTRADGEGDGYAKLSPKFLFRRLDSLTDLQFEGSFESYTFFNRRDLDSVDPALVIRFRYPFDPEVFATQELELRASRRTEANSDVGLRLRRDDLGLRWEGSFKATGKTILLTRTSANRTDYLTANFNTNDNASAGFTLAYVPNEKLQLGAGYDFEYSRSRPEDPAGLTTSRNQHLFALRGRGEFLPKITGSFFAGVTKDNYKGAIARSDSDVAAGASLGWKISERRQLAGTANRLTYFSPGGYAATHSSIGLEWTQEMSGGFSVAVGVEAERVSYRQIEVYRHDRSSGGHLKFSYALTERFSASLATYYTTQNSDETVSNYERGTVSATAAWQF